MPIGRADLLQPAAKLGIQSLPEALQGFLTRDWDLGAKDPLHLSPLSGFITSGVMTPS